MDVESAKRRTASGWSALVVNRQPADGGQFMKFDRSQLMRRGSNDRFPPLSDGAHPGAQHRAVGGRLMVRMVPGVFDGFRLRESADGQDAEHKQHRQNFEEIVIHRPTAYDILE